MEIDDTALGLVVGLMEQNAKFSADLTNSLMEGYERDAVKTEAILQLVRHDIAALFESGYMPTENAIMTALYPDYMLVEELTEKKMQFRKKQRGW